MESCEAVLSGLASGEMVEIRADLISSRGAGAVDDAGLASLCARPVPKVLTCRDLASAGFSDERRDLLVALMRSMAEGAKSHDAKFESMIDIEVEAPSEYREALLAAARENGVTVVISYHNYEETPSTEGLHEILADCRAKGADIAKVAVLCRNSRDAARVLALYDSESPVVALGMGAAGKVTRIAALDLGSPFTFVALSPETATAPGQLTLQQMRDIRSSAAGPQTATTA